MKPKLLLVLGLAVGYVLGARAGRARYDAIVGKADELWRSPRVQKARREVSDYAREQAPVIRAKAESVTKDVADRTATVARDVADKTQAVAKDVADKTQAVAGRTVSAVKDVTDKTVTAAKDTASRFGEARDRALAELDDEDDTL